MISKEYGEPYRVVRWHPGIRGTQRSFQLRTMIRDGRLWFACLDVQRALGWTKRELLRRRSERLDGSTWGTTTAQWEGRGPRLAFISLTGLQVVMVGRVTRHNRTFLRWLDGLDGVAVAGDAGDFVVDRLTIAQCSTHHSGIEAAECGWRGPPVCA